MERFETYIRQGLVKKNSPDIYRAKKLVKDGKERLFEIKDLDSQKMPKLIFENMYDVLRDFLLAFLLSEGYKTTSHEAPIAYLYSKGWNDYEIQKLDKFRYWRNGSKYYGESISVHQTEDIKEFYLQIKPKIDKLIKELKLE
jgi:hypothetical protein